MTACIETSVSFHQNMADKTPQVGQGGLCHESAAGVCVARWSIGSGDRYCDLTGAIRVIMGGEEKF